MTGKDLTDIDLENIEASARRGSTHQADTLLLVEEVRRLRGAVEAANRSLAACEHDWHLYGTVNGRPDYGCKKCGSTNRF